MQNRQENQEANLGPGDSEPGQGSAGEVRFELESQGVSRSAIFSPCRRYRYTLERRWSRGPMLLWILLNPSTATAEIDDATNRRGVAFSRLWGFGACVFVNLFAFRTPKPVVMRAVLDPVGPANDKHIDLMAMRADKIVIAWGNDGVHRHRDAEVLELLKKRTLWCMGVTKPGQPRHPLYLRNDAPLLTWPRRKNGNKK